MIPENRRTNIPAGAAPSAPRTDELIPSGDARLSFSPQKENTTRRKKNLFIFPPRPKHDKTTSNDRGAGFSWSHFIIYISGALRSRDLATAAARIPPAGTRDTDFCRARAQEAAYVLRHGVRRRAECAGTWECLLETQAGRVHAGASPSGSRRPISAHMEDGGWCGACAECGSGVRLLNNGREFIPASNRSLQKSSPQPVGTKDQIICFILSWCTPVPCSSLQGHFLEPGHH